MNTNNFKKLQFTFFALLVYFSSVTHIKLLAMEAVPMNEVNEVHIDMTTIPLEVPFEINGIWKAHADGITFKMLQQYLQEYITKNEKNIRDALLDQSSFHTGSRIINLWGHCALGQCGLILLGGVAILLPCGIIFAPPLRAETAAEALGRNNQLVLSMSITTGLIFGIPILIGSIGTFYLLSKPFFHKNFHKIKLKYNEYLNSNMNNKLFKEMLHYKETDIVPNEILKLFKHCFDDTFKIKMNFSQKKSLFTTKEIAPFMIAKFAELYSSIDFLNSSEANEENVLPMIYGPLFVSFLQEDPSYFEEVVRALQKKNLLNDNVKNALISTIPNKIRSEMIDFTPLFTSILEGKSTMMAVQMALGQQLLENTTTLEKDFKIVLANNEVLPINRSLLYSTSGEMFNVMLNNDFKETFTNEFHLNIPNLKANTLEKILFWNSGIEFPQIDEDQIEPVLEFSRFALRNDIRSAIDKILGKTVTSEMLRNDIWLSRMLVLVEEYQLTEVLMKFDHVLNKMYKQNLLEPQVNHLIMLKKLNIESAYNAGVEYFYNYYAKNKKFWANENNEKRINVILESIQIFTQSQKNEFFKEIMSLLDDKASDFLQSCIKYENVALGFLVKDYLRDDDASVNYFLQTTHSMGNFISLVEEYANQVNLNPDSLLRLRKFLVEKIKENPSLLEELIISSKVRVNMATIMDQFGETFGTIIFPIFFNCNERVLTNRVFLLLGTNLINTDDTFLKYISAIISHNKLLLKSFWEYASPNFLEQFILDQCKIYKKDLFMIFKGNIPLKIQQHVIGS